MVTVTSAMRKRHVAAKILYLTTMVGPITGFFCGFLVAEVGVLASAHQFDLLFVATVALVFGSSTGAVFMAIVGWSVRNASIREILRSLAGGTLLFALPVAFIPEYGFPLSMLSGMAGFWVGFVHLKNVRLQ